MISPVYIRSFSPPPVSHCEILRYARGGDDCQTKALLDACLREAESVLQYRVAYRILPFCPNEGGCDFFSFSVFSENLKKNLASCRRVVLFAATVGTGIDRLIARYSALSPAKALLLQALGSERVEALCDAFCRELEEEYGPLRPRFSPGYGDLPISLQRDVLSVLEAGRIGITLNDHYLMSPSKSVTAFVGITETEKK